MKDVMRNHIKNLCDNEYCADTLLIYLNSPAKPDGSSLLWDFSDDGVVRIPTYVKLASRYVIISNLKLQMIHRLEKLIHSSLKYIHQRTGCF